MDKPQWTEGKATHYMMYEECSEGTPLSPAFSTPEELARWLVDNNVDEFGGRLIDYSAWLRICRGGPSRAGVLYV